MLRSPKTILTLSLLALLLAGCAFGSHKTARASPLTSHTDAVLYGIGVSTDPYGNSTPNGFGVVTGLLQGKLAKVEIRGQRWGAERAAWLGLGKVLIPERGADAPACSRQVMFRFREGRLTRIGRVPLALPRDTWNFALSPDRTLVAFEPSVSCCGGGQKPGGVVLVARPDGSGRHPVARGHFAGWTPDGRVLLSTGVLFEFVQGSFRAVTVTTKREKLVLSSRDVAARAHALRAQIASPVWSADRHYFAGRATFIPAHTRRQRSAVAVARADGSIIQLLRSRYAISMFAWSPRGHRLAYTTSGFPTPHELFVVDRPGAEPRRIFRTGRHFDWVTWSPNGRSLLVDDEAVGRWRLLAASGVGVGRAFPRLGGRPIWCCPQSDFSGG